VAESLASNVTRVIRRGGLIPLVLVAAFAMTTAADAGRASIDSARATVVPQVIGTDLFSAYRRLHAAGLRVNIPAGLTIDPRLGLVTKQDLRPGETVSRGSTVTIQIGCTCRLGRMRLPRTQPAYVVPDFRGRLVTAASDWIKHKTLFFLVHLGPLRSGRANALYANYRETRQSPAPGTTLRFSASAGRTTPLTVWARQDH
jgi:hypothetical protein